MILLLLLPIFLLAIPPLDKVFNYPDSYYRDFYLTTYLKKTNSPQEAENIYNEITHKKKYQLKLLSKKYPLYKDIYNCKYPNRFNWIDVDYNCILDNGFRLSDINRMDDAAVKSLLNYLPDSKIKTEIEILFDKNYKKAFNKKYFYDLYYLLPDMNIPDIYLNELAKDRRFYRFLSSVVRSNKNQMKESLLDIHYKEVRDRDKFLLALNAITLKRYNLAIKILQSKKYKTTKDLFWLYLLTKNNIYAKKLLKHKRLDFYTMFIYEKFHKPIKIDKVKIFNTSDVIYNINNPLDVINFYQDKSSIKNYFNFAKKLDNQKMLPLKTLVLDKAYKYTKNFYIMPKYNLKDFNITQKALFYALARQESRFIPAQISHSYAIGLMQMMPFLIKSFHPKEDISEFFEAKTNVKYAKKHIKWLMKYLHHPLFVAYAYNGGIGFTRRKVIKYFKFKGEFEPFLSMELVPYSESREYGKKVLTNYVIYNQLLGNKITLHQLLKVKK